MWASRFGARITISACRAIYCYCRIWMWRLSVDVAIFIRDHCGRKPQMCRWNFGPVRSSSKYINISGFGGHIAISCCWSLSQLLETLSLSLLSSMWSTTPDLLLEFRCCMSQFQKYYHFLFGGHIDVSGCPSISHYEAVL